jgi:CBS domain-containing protein
MRCPACGYDNLTGAEICDNCGAELFGHDVPQQAPAFQSRLLGEHIEDLRASAPLTVDPDASVADAIARMQHEEADCVLVVSDGRLIGIFTDRDALLKIAGRDDAPARVRDVMTPDPVVLRHDDPIAVAIHKMAVGGFRHIPIVEHGRPTGVVSARDVFQHLAEMID